MIYRSRYHVVIDTNVVFEGLTQTGSAAGLVVEAWQHGLICPHVSNALAYEYVDVLSRKLSPAKWDKIQPVLKFMLTQARFVKIHYTWRPSSPDPGDDLVIDCALNAGVPVVTSNLRDFRSAHYALGLKIMAPLAFVTLLADM